MHLWWARRPLAACRAVLFAQLVDDPSAHPERFPTEELQATERERLFALLEELVVWENTSNDALLKRAHDEIAACYDGEVPTIIDPFSGGGSIPLEAQRLGLPTEGSDLNPVAVLISKALVELPAQWANCPPVFPESADARLDWSGASGLAEDVRRYGSVLRTRSEAALSRHYPSVQYQGRAVTPLVWLWTRTARCPNPACRAQMPLLTTLWLSKNKKRPTWLDPVVEGNKVSFKIGRDGDGPSRGPAKQGRGARFKCLACDTATEEKYIKAEASAGRLGFQLLATVVDSGRGRDYLPADHLQAAAADVDHPDDAPDAELANDPRNLWCVNYGLTKWSDLFTARQLLTMTTLAGLVPDVREQVLADAARSTAIADPRKYADAVATYLAFAVSSAADDLSTLVTWRVSHGSGATSHTFKRQSLPMTWDFAEANPFANATGDLQTLCEAEARVLERLPAKLGGTIKMADASHSVKTGVFSTDPPYYDNISYADLSDFFYVWLRPALRDVFPDLLATVVTPKSEELVAMPHRFNNRLEAEEHFERGFVRTFARIRHGQPHDTPVTLFYAFKQAEGDESGVASTGWETMLNGLIEAGLTITATWPMRTERDFGLKTGTNVLASSIVLACRPLEEAATATTRRAFLQTLREELPAALKEMQQASIAPVDLAQAAIGPGMAVFTRYPGVLEADGAPMTVRTALALINHALDEVLAEQEGDFDADTRFCLKWFDHFGWSEQPFGRAEELSRATNTSVDGLVRGGAFWARAGKARLLNVAELSEQWSPESDDRISVWEVVVRLAKALSERGADAAADLLHASGKRVDLDTAKELAYLLFSISEKHGWSDSALLFNGLGTSWSELASSRQSAAAVGVPLQESLLPEDEEL